MVAGKEVNYNHVNFNYKKEKDMEDNQDNLTTCCPLIYSRFDHTGNETEIGIIPSKSRWEKKARARERNVHWDSRGGSSKNSLRSKKSIASGKNRGGQFIKGKETDETSNASMETADSLANEVDQNSLRSTGQDLAEGPIYSYELVQEVEIDYTRPVVILGRVLPMVHNYIYRTLSLYQIK